MKEFFKFLSLFCVIVLSSCSQPHTHTIGSYESIDKKITP